MVPVGWRFQAQVGSSQANFGEVGKSYSTILSNKGMRCANPPQAEDRCKTTRRPARPRTAPHRKTWVRDRKSTRLNSSHSQISYAVFCLKKKKKKSKKEDRREIHMMRDL